MKILVILALVVLTLAGTFAECYVVFGSEYEKENRICAVVMGAVLFLADIMCLIELTKML